MSNPARMFHRFIKDLPPGELTWIGLRPERKAPMIEITKVQALAELGLEGDHRCDKTPGSARQVTIISQEYIQLIQSFMHINSISPALLRRNLVVKNINLTALRHQKFQIGTAVFEATALCHPCSRMEAALGKGAVVAMLGLGGFCAKILTSGEISVGDKVQIIV